MKALRYIWNNRWLCGIIGYPILALALSGGIRYYSVLLFVLLILIGILFILRAHWPKGKNLVEKMEKI